MTYHPNVLTGLGGGGGVVAWSAITGKPATFPPDAHSNSISDVTGLTAALANYADDTAAAAGGVAIGSLYRTGSAVKVRVT